MNQPTLEDAIGACVAEVTRGAYRLARLWHAEATLSLSLEPSNVTAEARALVIEVRRAAEGVRAYRVVSGYALGYRGSALSLEERRVVDATIGSLAPLLVARAYDPEQSHSPAAPTGAARFPTPWQLAELDREPTIDPAVVARFRRDGHVLLRRVLPPQLLRALRPHVTAALGRAWPRGLPPPQQRPDAYSRSFTQITDLWPHEPATRALALSPRLAALAATLMGVPRVRLFCEDWLVKEPGALITPWHQDAAVFPFDAEATLTLWIPLQDVRGVQGRLRYARGSHHHGLADVEDINDVSEALYAERIAALGLVVDELPDVHLGDVAAHDGRTIHGALPNLGEGARIALALHCFADGARIIAPRTPRMAGVLAGSAPDLTPGAVAESPRWPRLEPRADDAPRVELAERTPPLIVRGRCLETDRDVEWYVVDGRYQRGPVDGAVVFGPVGAFLAPGLVDAHAHLSYPHTRDEPVGTEAWMNARRAEHAGTGVALLRDMGAVGDEICELTDVPGLPRVQPSGTMILRHEEFPFTPTAPHELVERCADRIRNGAAWVKVFADWSSDYRGRENSGFTGDDAVTYPEALLAAAVRAVHELGGRVAAHAFTREGAAVAIAARVDSLEHGWGLDDPLLGELVERQVAWAPLVGIAPHLWRVARRDAEPERVAWVEERVAAMSELLPLAERRGARLLVGTDMFPDVLVADEARQLVELGVSARTVVLAATSQGRRYLGERGLDEGAVADLVMFAEDPRLALDALARPVAILAGGTRVLPSTLHVRPRFVSWAERERA